MRHLLPQNNALGVLVLMILLGLAVNCTNPYSQGQLLYETNCSRCHGADGRGFENLYPGLDSSPWLVQPGGDLPCVIAYGSEFLNRMREATTTVTMPSNEHLSPVEVLNIINYLSWEYGEGRQMTTDEVIQALEECKPEGSLEL